MRIISTGTISGIAHVIQLGIQTSNLQVNLTDEPRLDLNTLTVSCKDYKMDMKRQPIQNQFWSRKRKNSQDPVQFVYDIGKLLSLARPSFPEIFVLDVRRCGDPDCQ